MCMYLTYKIQILIFTQIAPPSRLRPDWGSTKRRGEKDDKLRVCSLFKQNENYSKLWYQCLLG